MNIYIYMYVYILYAYIYTGTSLATHRHRLVSGWTFSKPTARTSRDLPRAGSVSTALGNNGSKSKSQFGPLSSATATTRWITCLSSTVNLPDPITFKTLCGANVVT